MIDYWITANRWTNAITDVETDPEANITMHHYPLIVKTKTNLKLLDKKQKMGNQNAE